MSRVFNKDFRKIDYNLKDVYQYYKKVTPDTVNYSLFSEILKSFNLHFAKELYDGSYLKLPYRLGNIFVYKYKPKYKFDEEGNLINHGQNNMIDYKATKELWKEHPELKHKQRVFYDNDHSDGFKFKIKWKVGKVRNIRLYNFIPAKSLKRNLAKYIRSNPNQDYYDN